MDLSLPDLTDSNKAIARLCRAYAKCLIDPNEDAFFNWLSALHSMHDRVPTQMRENLWTIPEFIALKAIRNYFHHEGEVAHRIRILHAESVSLTCDLPILCLLERDVVESAFEAIPTKFAEKDQPLARKSLNWYGPCVNVNPAIFNLMALLVVRAEIHGLEPDESEFDRLANAVRHDRANGRPITVDGHFACHAADIDKILSSVMKAD